MGVVRLTGSDALLGKPLGVIELMFGVPLAFGVVNPPKVRRSPLPFAK